MAENAPERFVAGAIDLGEVKSRAEAKGHTQGRDAGHTVAPVVDVTEQNIKSEVLERSMQVPVVVHIGTQRSPESAEMHTVLSRLANTQEQISWIYAYLDADRTPQLAQALGVQGLPTVLALAQGQPITDFQGGQPEEALQQWTAAVVGAVAGKLEGLPGEEPEEDPRIAQVRSLLDAAEPDLDQALPILEEALAEHPEDPELVQLSKRAEVIQRARASEAAADDEGDAAQGGVDKHYAAADALIAHGRVEEAFDGLIAAITQAEGEEKAALKDRLIELFGMYETADPRVLAARGKLASALY
ncbi:MULTISPECIES: tetratricopeptide repeat protein [unclassified Corynebacterium]|uniref:tetratricopeptide repeat protein n=1 Tax=unclassified Corynebacterium TaxID=2624378 RepID=UPI001C4506DE|nr:MULTISPECIES: tetratricopeptide repeat protein [unclassified Corynebacterium]MBV7281499.1 tetratricopeptide repeat protein [Corynebacterium sp. TAE3-ERU30]MBV7301139.1 tetratricopeptide repeat protein [Corynebacterium sp. TAE3-ERU2]